MADPITKLTLSAVVASATGGYRLTPEATGDFTPVVSFQPTAPWVAGITDLNGDSTPDLIIGAPGSDDKDTDAGRIFVVFGSATGGFTGQLGAAATAEIILDGVTADDLAGAAVGSVKDLNGDSRAEILVGAPQVDDGALVDAGAAFVVWGLSAAGGVDLGDPTNGDGKGYIIKGEAAYDHAGQTLTSIGDLNGDGKAEILVGASGSDAGGTDSGAAYVVWGKSSKTAVNLSSVAAGAGGFRIVGENADDAAGQTLAALGDQNGDGKAEILVGAAGNDAGGLDAGAAYVVFGKATGTAVNLETIAAGTGGYRITGEVGDNAGSVLTGLGDINGDGQADIFVGAPGSGKAYVVFGKSDTSEVLLSDVANGIGGFVITPEFSSDLAQLSVAAGGDFNRDGIADIIIGAPTNDEGGFNAGAVYVVWGGGNNPIDLSTIASGIGGAKIIGSAGSLTGSSVAVLPDMNGDSTPDLLIGSSGDGSESVSVVYTPSDWQPDTKIYGTENMDFIGEGYGGAYKVGAGDDVILGLGGDDIVYAADGNDIVDGGDGNDILHGEAGNDTLDGGAGDDTLIGGLGNDSYRVDTANDMIFEGDGEGIDTVVATDISYTLGENIENLQLAGTALDGTGNAIANTLIGTDADNILDGAGGADILIGGLGNDTYLVDNSADITQEAFNKGIDTVIASADYALGENIENLQLTDSAHIGTGNALDNVITGSTGGDQLNGGAGNDSLDGGAGGDAMAGGSGDDTYYVDNVGDTALELTGEGDDTAYVSVNNWVAGANIEHVRLIGDAHVITGNALNNSLSGGAGDDVIDGGAGDDTELGGDGNDVLISSAGLDTLAGGSGDDRYVLKGGSAHIEDFLGHDTIDASEASGDSSIDLSSGHCHVEGSDSDLGTGGSTVLPLDVQFLQDLSGSFGDDIATVQGLVPQIVSALQAVQVNSEFGSSTFVDKPIDPFGAPGEWVYDTLLPLTSNVTTLTNAYNGMIIRYGNDEPEAQIESLMQLALHSAEVGFRPDSARFVVLFTDAPFHQAGDGAAAGITTPNNGDAIMDGGSIGEDYPLIPQVQAALTAANIIPIFAIANGYESVYQSLVTALGRGTVVSLTSDSSNVVAAITAGLTAATTTQIEDATGGVGNDTLTGNSLANTLIGNNGNDHLNGSAGNDAITGGTGNDVLTGGTGSDTFIFSHGDGQDEITDDSAGNTSTDVVQFTNIASGDVVSVAHDPLNTNNLILVYGSGDQITIDGFFGANPNGSIAQFKFSNNVTWTRADVLSLVGENTNEAPVLTGTPTVLADGSEDAAQIITAAELLTGYTDANGDALSVANVTADHGLFADKGDGTWTFTPEANYNGAVIVSYQVTDGKGGIASASQSFSLAAINDTPALTETVVTLADGSENTNYTIYEADLLAGYTDVDGDILSISGLVADTGTLIDNSDGTWTFAPTINFSGTVNLSYDIVDNNGGGISTSQSFNLLAINEAPVLTGTPAVLADGNEDITQTLSAAELLLGFTDANGDSLSVTGIAADHGSLVDNGNNTWTFAPEANYTGVVALGYNVDDGNGGVTPANLSFNLAAINDTPALTGSQTVLNDGSEDTAVVIDPAELILGYTDVDGDALSVSQLTAEHGILSDNGDNTWTFTPDTNYNGLVALSYKVEDGNGGIVAASQSFNLAAVNDAPLMGSVTVNPAATTASSINYSGSLSFTDVDTSDTHSSSPLSAVGLAGGSLATSIIENAGSGIANWQYSYTLPLTFAATAQTKTDSFTVSVNDGHGGIASQDISINVSTGTSAANTLAGTSGIDILLGGAGNDTFNGAANNDVLVGGIGNDTYSIDASGIVVLENGSEGTDLVKSSLDYALAGNIENLTLTGTAINGTGNSLVNSITGNANNNVLDGGIGDDKLIGGLGDDTYLVDSSLDIVTEAASAGTDTVLSSASNYTLAGNVENLTLVGAGSNDGTGNTLANIITGNSGNNILSGGTGADSLIGGAGNDSYVVDNVGDVVNEKTDEGTDLINSSVTFTLPINVENLTLTKTGNINGNGNADANVLIGNAGNNILDGGLGADSLAGGLGNDTYVVDVLGDSVTENAGEGTDLVKTAISFDLNATVNIEKLTLTGTGNINGTGDAGNNAITGNVGNNILIGGAGADTLVGGGGNDTFVVNITATGALEDTITAGTGNDTIQVFGDYAGLAVTLTAASNIENYDISGTGISLLNVTGNSRVNTITGNAANNLLNGGAGADSLIGGAGDDTYTVDNIGDALTESSGGGIDSVNSSVTYALPANVENLSLTGTGAINGTGNSDANSIVGNTGKNTLSGGAGNDVLTGGKGQDTLSGGTDSDTFKFTAGDNGATATSFDRIIDFTKGAFGTGDLIDYVSALAIGGSNNAATASQASINQTTGIASFFAGSGATLTDAVGDIAARFTAAGDSVGEFAFFNVNGTGDTYLLISDGVAGIGANDVLVDLVGVSSVASISVFGGDLLIAA